MKRDKIIYWVVTGVFCAMMLFAAIMYFAQNPMVREEFTKLGFPTYIIYPLAIAKILGVIAILSKKSKLLKEWAYAGFFYDFILASSAHWNANDGEFAPPLVIMCLLLISRFYETKVFA
ncbi:MAG: DoxX family protein [Spirochaetota bacterium]